MAALARALAAVAVRWRAAAPPATLGTAPGRLENSFKPLMRPTVVHSAAERRWCWRRTSDTQQDHAYRNKREEQDYSAVAQVQGDLFRPSTGGEGQEEAAVAGGFEARPLTRPTVALEHHTSVVFVSSVLRSHVKAFPRSAALPRNLRPPHEVRGRSPSFVPFLSCVHCRIIAAFAAACSRRQGCSVAHAARCTLRCAPPAHPRAFTRARASS